MTSASWRSGNAEQFHRSTPRPPSHLSRNLNSDATSTLTSHRKMARLPFAAALVTALVLLLLLTSHLTAPFFPTIPNLQTFLRHVCHPTTFISSNGQPHTAGATDQGTPYLLGVGKADITGPVVEINLMGYADPDQVGTGLRQRLYSRTFIIGSTENLTERFVYMVLDTQSGDTAVRYGILDELAKLGGEYAVYGQQNVAVIGTHSHSGPGAWLNYLLPQITSKGFDKQSYQAIVDGAVLSIKRAHESLKPGYLSVGHANVEGGNVNRSPYAYLQNPEEERARYKGDVDEEITVLKFWDQESGKGRGVLTWFPVHGTSLYGNNTLVSGDNKGVAAWLFEEAVKGQESEDEGFVAGFSQSNVGDTSPNVLGAYCEDGSGQQCSFKESLCNGKTQACHGRGPRFTAKDNGAASCYEIGRRQFVAAKSAYDLMDEIGTPVSGPSVKAVHSFHDLSNYTFPHPNGTTLHTCPAALGYSFAAGTTDGPGAFDFKQNDPGKPNANPLWAVVSGALKEPSKEQKACHAPKPILLDVGEIHKPYQWTPNIVDIQLLRVGQLFIIVSPGEATTMSGRRWKDAIYGEVKAISLAENGDPDPIVLLGGPANSYTHYIATPEEYSVQRYEGASTLYGPSTLDAFIHLSTLHLPYLSAENSSFPTSPVYPPNNVNASMSFITPVIFDNAPLFKSYGDILQDVKPTYVVGQNVIARFVAANPRNDLRLEDTYAAVEMKDGGKWKRVRDDKDWGLVFEWKRVSTILGTSEVTITWTVDEMVERGRYRIRYFGASTGVLGGLEGFEGVSGTFEIV
ncbi:uncharacterized protein KY384_006230 [Bacidia gigantensis]|uniref:uncharacterized protein n=1 Tax=Bacidia gigantensis TaxID=2732470 RepID=UPI001D038729|nr:uncharacterized protein KY384_006230 [Bacidia gigantensis]KAG8529593.1 hypothetical protein KY384_006230 [Bacidia gigantensis]